MCKKIVRKLKIQKHVSQLEVNGIAWGQAPFETDSCFSFLVPGFISLSQLRN
jgi:hypothetical protein